MGDRTGIEWTDATWNPVTGCTRVTTGCDHCYAAALAEKRLRHVYLKRSPAADTPENRIDPFAVRLWPERLDQPIAWTEPRMIFVNSMSDLFHADVPDEFVLAVFEVMLTADQHIYQVLTKRPARAARFWQRHAAERGFGPYPDTSGSERPSRTPASPTGPDISAPFAQRSDSFPANLSSDRSTA